MDRLRPDDRGTAQRRFVSAALMTKAIAVVLWLLILGAPVGTAIAWTSKLHHPSPPTATGRPTPGRSGLGPSSFAMDYVEAWAVASRGSEQLVRAYFPGAPVLAFPPHRRIVSDLRSTSAVEIRPGYWAVTVTGHVSEPHDGGRVTVRRYWRVGVVAAGPPSAGGTGGTDVPATYVATGLPTEVAGPAMAGLADTAYVGTVDGAPGAVGQAVAGFLAAYLAGQPGLERYIAPGVALAVPSPVPYTAVAVTRMGADVDLDRVNRGAATTGERIRVLATVNPQSPEGAMPPLQYALTLVGRAGRWEIAAIGEAPDLSQPSTTDPSLPTGRSKESR